MNRKNVIRTVAAIAVVVLLGWSFFYFSDDTRGYKPVDTSVAMTQITGGNVKSAQIDDREQQLRLTLNKGNNDTENSDKIITKYPNGYAVDLFNALTAKNAKVRSWPRPGSPRGDQPLPAPRSVTDASMAALAIATSWPTTISEE